MFSAKVVWFTTIFQFHGSHLEFNRMSDTGLSYSWITKYLLQKLFNVPNNLGMNPFSGPIGHFETQLRPYWIFQVSNTGISYTRIEQTFAKVVRSTQYPGHKKPNCGHLGFLRCQI